MKVKIKDLTGLQLDYAVALCEGYGPDQYMRNIDIRLDVTGKASCLLVPINREYVTWAPTTCQQGDEIIDREKISVSWTGKDWLGAVLITPDPGYCSFGHKHYAPTRRIAAMRCYVASVRGDEIDLPERLA